MPATISIPQPGGSLDENSSIVSATSIDAIDAIAPSPPSPPLPSAQRTSTSVAAAHDMHDAPGLGQSPRAHQLDGRTHQREANERRHDPHAADSHRHRHRASRSDANSSPPADLSSYARLMLEHTKQQMQLTSASPPPAHIRVAGPLGTSQQHQERRRNGSASHSHAGTMANGTTAALPNGIAASERSS